MDMVTYRLVSKARDQSMNLTNQRAVIAHIHLIATIVLAQVTAAYRQAVQAVIHQAVHQAAANQKKMNQTKTSRMLN